MFYLHDGAFHELPEGADLPEGAVAVPRLPADGERWDGAGFVFDGAALVAEVHAAIDAQAEAIRARFITASPGQAMTYLQKDAEARAWLADHNAPTPMLSAEAEALGIPVGTLAGQVIANADLWGLIGGKIEGARRAAKQAASAATSAAGVRAALNINWQDVIGV